MELRHKEFSYRPEIDGLRAIAVLLVLLNHSWEDQFSFGFAGVDVFFVISGFVVMTSIVHRLDGHSGIDHRFILSFYSRRIARLYPSLLLVISSFCFILFLFLLPGDSPYESSLRTGITAIFGLSNIQLWRTASDYFASSSSYNFFTHTWSLGVEEQFYILFPVLLCLIKRRFWFFGLCLLSSASLIAYLFALSVEPVAVFYLMPFRFWEIGLGSLVALALPVCLRRWSWLSHPWLGTSLLGVVVLFFSFLEAPGWPIVVIVFATGLLLLNLSADQGAGQLLASPPLVAIGLLSYSLYLWHWPVMVLVRHTVYSAIGHSGFVLLSLSLTVLLSCCSYAWCEKPARAFFKSVGPASLLRLGVSCSALIAGLIWFLPQRFPGGLFLGRSEHLQQAMERESPSAPADCNVTNQLDQASLIGCSHLEPEPSGLPTVYLVGDSHGEQFYWPLHNFLAHKGWGLKAYVVNSCVFPPVGFESQLCIQRQSAVSDEVIKLVRPGDVVIIGASYVQKLGLHESDDLVASSKLLQVKQGLIGFLDQVSLREVNMVLYVDGPQFLRLGETPISQCSREWFRPVLSDGCELSASEVTVQRDKLHDLFAVLSELPFVEIWDPLVDLKRAEALYSPQGYIDGTHYSRGLADKLFSAFAFRSKSFQ